MKFEAECMPDNPNVKIGTIVPTFEDGSFLFRDSEGILRETGRIVLLGMDDDAVEDMVKGRLKIEELFKGTEPDYELIYPLSVKGFGPALMRARVDIRGNNGTAKLSVTEFREITPVHLRPQTF